MSNNFNIFIPEILELILHYVDCQTLANCRLVNKYWKEIADYVGKNHGHWKRFAKKKMFNNGSNLKQKSKLNWCELYTNTQLWSHLSEANASLCNSIPLEEKAMHVYGDHVIVIQDYQVAYYNTETLVQVRCLVKESNPTSFLKPDTYFDFNETDELIMEVNFTNFENARALCVILYGKEYVNHFDLQRQRKSVIDNVMKYKLNNNVCLIFDRNGVAWEHLWQNKEYKINFLAKCFDLYKNIEQISMFNDDIYILIAGSQRIFKVDRKAKNFEFFSVLPRKLLLMDPFLLVSDNAYSINLLQEKLPKLSNLACAISHASVGIYGYHDGKVNIHLCMDSKYSSLHLSLTNFGFIEEHNIRSLDVYERKDSHYLFVLTEANLHQILIQYPEEIKDSITSKLQHLIIIHSVCISMFLTHDVNGLIIIENETSSNSDLMDEATNKPNSYYKYNIKMLDLNGTMRKYFATEALLQEPKNIILSPLAAMLPIGKLYFGGGNEVKREIEDAFGLGYADEIERVLFHAISNMEKLEGIHLNIALFMLLPKYNEVRKEYKEDVMKIFRYNLLNVDFKRKAHVAEYTNFMFKVLTGGVTGKILDPSEIETNSSLVVLNTCLFKGDWLVPFADVDNFVFESELGLKKYVHGFRMAALSKYINDSTLHAEIIEINFKTDEACFLVVLPQRHTNIRSVLSVIKSDPVLLRNAINNMTKVATEITLPKFEIENKLDLNELYNKVGVNKIFNSTSPGLTQLLVRGAPWVTSVKQLVKFRLTNLFAIGSADDAGLLSFGARKKMPITHLFSADRPFIFYVLHRGEQLFVGAVYDP